MILYKNYNVDTPGNWTTLSASNITCDYPPYTGKKFRVGNGT